MDSRTAHVRVYERVINGHVVKVQAYDRASPWRSHANPDFREHIAFAERSHDKPNNGYGAVNTRGGAAGRYSIMPDTFVQIGWKDVDGTWTEKAKAYGMREADPEEIKTDPHNVRSFLESPEAQEAAFDDVLRDYEKQADAYRLFDRVGTTVSGEGGFIQITEAGIVGAVHRRGADATAKYFKKIDQAAIRFRRPRLNDKERQIEKRIRDFRDVPYHRMQSRP